jgi:hypothetical protein
MKTAANATSRNRDGVTVERGAQRGRMATKVPRPMSTTPRMSLRTEPGFTVVE